METIEHTVQVNWMRDRNLCASSLLNDPVRPNTLSRQLDEIVDLRIAGIAGDDVLQRWFLPVDVNGGQIDAPNNDTLVVSLDFRDINVHIEGRGLIQEV